MKDLIIRKFKVNFWDSFENNILESIFTKNCKCKIHNGHKAIFKANSREDCILILSEFKENLDEAATCLKSYDIHGNTLDFVHTYSQFQDPNNKNSQIQNLNQNIRFKFKINKELMIKSIIIYPTKTIVVEKF